MKFKPYFKTVLVALVVSAAFAAGLVVNEFRHGREVVARENVKRDYRGRAKRDARRLVREHGLAANREVREQARKIIAAHGSKDEPGTNMSLSAAFKVGQAYNRLDRIRRGGAVNEAEEKEFSAEERAVFEAADRAISEHELKAAIEVAEKARASKDAAVRKRAVEALTEFGEAGLPEMADFLNDPDPDVAELAADRFDLSTQEIENDEERVGVAKLAMLTLNDPDQLSSMAGTLLLASDSLLVVSALTEIIEGGTSVQAEAAKEAYQSQTAEEWQGVEAAEKWLQENYEPPEADE